ncbi:hypothetical protein Cycma_2147 [Cyclobacterium marinum DSM 745]|uniref:Uncharacterized protein n=1 Tax=Cyclobacterium marinum (strain ATCC 25205 / DSM 745 / LMG 13164 / NCIMB 1802) TaxID=880070 RepID=G0J2K1_CYCMS|nr:hypothetical protein Cycma_2147 [Cyclobacterium marinum DSM 745]
MGKKNEKVKPNNPKNLKKLTGGQSIIKTYLLIK